MVGVVSLFFKPIVRICGNLLRNGYMINFFSHGWSGVAIFQIWNITLALHHSLWDTFKDFLIKSLWHIPEKSATNLS